MIKLLVVLLTWIAGGVFQQLLDAPTAKFFDGDGFAAIMATAYQ